MNRATGPNGRRASAFSSALLLCVLLASELPAGRQEKGMFALPPVYQKWLDTDVVYIITSQEREVFLKLKTDRERDSFIEAFWKQRDPTPGTPENEFKLEHYRRITYANERLGRETTRPGWQTDRGRIYILLGPPTDISDIQGSAAVQPAQIWYYEGKLEYGLPGHFRLVFFKRDGLGEYVLYSPAQDGPARLLINYRGDPTDRQEAYLRLQRYDARLADASLSLLEDETPLLGQTSLASEQLTQQIGSLPGKMVNARYVDAFLKYKDVIEVEYTANYVPSETAIGVFEAPSGVFFIHYSLEPKRLSILAQGERYRLNFALNGILTDSKGRVVFQYEKNIPLDFRKDQVEEIQKTSLALQDMIPMIPGEYEFSLLAKNTFSKEFMSAEGRVSIPEKPISFQIGSVLLGYKRKTVAAPAESNKPFAFGPDLISCQAGNVFHPKENLVVFCQVFGLPSGLAKRGSVKFSVLDGAKELAASTQPLSPADPLNILEEIPLKNLPPGYYKIRVSILDEGKKEVASKTQDFVVSALADVPRPWIVSRVMPSSKDPEYDYILGIQSDSAGRPAEAERFLKSAFEANKASLKYAVGYAQALIQKKDFRAVLDILNPFSSKTEEDDRILAAMGASHEGLGEYKEAIEFYKKYLSHAGANLAILNSIGTCYYRLGDYKEALAYLEKSLELNPRQDSIQKLVAEIKQKK
jgi:GWxTD domain-containing protein